MLNVRALRALLDLDLRRWSGVHDWVTTGPGSPRLAGRAAPFGSPGRFQRESWGAGGAIRVEQGKGRKDRYTLLSPRLLEELKAYWQCFRPEHWLFPASNDPRLPMDERVGQKIFYGAVKRAGLPRRGGIHSLRHSFATHLLESGVEITVVQRLLGHTSLSTTSNYLHVRQERLAQIKSPLQLLDLGQIPKLKR